MRLFVALSPPAEALDELEAAVAPLRPARPDLRWTSPQSWHVTLAFLGEVEDKVLARLAGRLERKAAHHASLVLTAAGAGAFPTAPRARVLWTGLRGDHEALRDLADAVAAGAEKAGAPPRRSGAPPRRAGASAPDGNARRRFRPHITLARAREPADVSRLVGALSDYVGTPWLADRVHLIRSHLGPQTWYESVGDWPLRAPAGPTAEPPPAPRSPAAPGAGTG